MRQLLKITDNLARLIAVIDIGKQICEHLYRIQTCNLLIRSQTLYSIELRDHFSFLALQSYCHFLNWQAFLQKIFQKFFERKPQIDIIYHNVNQLGARSFFSSATR